MGRRRCLRVERDRTAHEPGRRRVHEARRVIRHLVAREAERPIGARGHDVGEPRAEADGRPRDAVPRLVRDVPHDERHGQQVVPAPLQAHAGRRLAAPDAHGRAQHSCPSARSRRDRRLGPLALRSRDRLQSERPVRRGQPRPSPQDAHPPTQSTRRSARRAAALPSRPRRRPRWPRDARGRCGRPRDRRPCPRRAPPRRGRSRPPPRSGTCRRSRPGRERPRTGSAHPPPRPSSLPRSSRLRSGVIRTRAPATGAPVSPSTTMPTRGARGLVDRWTTTSKGTRSPGDGYGEGPRKARCALRRRPPRATSPARAGWGRGSPRRRTRRRARSRSRSGTRRTRPPPCPSSSRPRRHARPRRARCRTTRRPVRARSRRARRGPRPRRPRRPARPPTRTRDGDRCALHRDVGRRLRHEAERPRRVRGRCARLRSDGQRRFDEHSDALQRPTPDHGPRHGPTLAVHDAPDEGGTRVRRRRLRAPVGGEAGRGRCRAVTRSLASLGAFRRGIRVGSLALQGHRRGPVGEPRDDPRDREEARQEEDASGNSGGVGGRAGHAHHATSLAPPAHGFPGGACGAKIARAVPYAGLRRTLPPPPPPPAAPLLRCPFLPAPEPPTSR